MYVNINVGGNAPYDPSKGGKPPFNPHHRDALTEARPGEAGWPHIGDPIYTALLCMSILMCTLFKIITQLFDGCLYDDTNEFSE